MGYVISLHGRTTIVFKLVDKLAAFKAKLEACWRWRLWKRLILGLHSNARSLVSVVWVWVLFYNHKRPAKLEGMDPRFTCEQVGRRPTTEVINWWCPLKYISDFKSLIWINFKAEYPEIATKSTGNPYISNILSLWCGVSAVRATKNESME